MARGNKTVKVDKKQIVNAAPEKPQLIVPESATLTHVPAHSKQLWSRSIHDPAKVVKLKAVLTKKVKSPMRIWAERGHVHCEHGDTGEYESTTWQESALRVLSISDMVKKSDKEGVSAFYRDEIVILKKFIADMHAVLEEAKAQGNYLQKGAAEKYAMARRKIFVMPEKTLVW